MNNFTLNKSLFCFILSLSLLFAANPAKAQIFVDATRPDNSGNGLSAVTAKKTITAGISVATAGQTVNIAAGTYAENVVVNQSIILLGADPTTTIISGGGSGTGISIQANNVTIQNIATTGFQDGIRLDISIVAPNFTTLDNINSSFNTRYGFHSNALAVTNLTITNSTLNNNTPNSGRGIMIQSSANTFNNLIFTNNIISDNNLVGIDVSSNGGLNNLTITGNTINDNGDAGIAIFAGNPSPATNTMLVSNNQISMKANQRFGIELKNVVGNGLETGAGSAVISDNLIVQTAIGTNSRDFAGIAIIRRKDDVAARQDPSGIVITKNTIRNIRPGVPNIGNGFGIAAGGTNMLITFNNIEGCQVGIQMQASNINSGNATNSPSTTGQANTLFFDRDNSPLSSGTIRYNKIIKSIATDQGIRNIGSISSSILDATGNWFGDVSGPNSGTNTLGSGADVLSQSVTGTTAATFVFTDQPSHTAFNPWLALDPDDLVSDATLERGVQISSSKTYRATNLATSTGIGPIQQGINIASIGFKDILDIRDGIYLIPAMIRITKPIELRGDGGFIAAGVRPLLTSVGTIKAVLSVEAQNITIDNLHLKVDGTSTSANRKYGIFVVNHNISLSYNNLIIKNNFIENINPTTVGNGGLNFFAFGIGLSQDGNLLARGDNNLTITNNTIYSVAGNALFGRGIRSLGNYGLINNNNFTSYYGMQLPNIFGGNMSVDNNVFNVVGEAGIEINVPNQNNGVHTISNNTFTSALVSFPTFAMIEVKDNNNAGNISTINITANTFTDVVTFGVFVGRSSNVNIVNNTFTPKAANIDYNHIHINTKFRVSNNIIVTPVACDNISIQGNNFMANAVLGGSAILFANHASGVNPAFTNVSIGGNVAGQENSFAANIARFISLDPFAGSSGAIIPAIWLPSTSPSATPTIAVAENFDAQFNNYNVGSGFAFPSAMSDVDLIKLEDKISHKIDYKDLGFITIKPNHIFVSQNSFLSSFTTSPRIQRGTSVPTADGFTLNVEGFAYSDDALTIPTTAFNMNFMPVNGIVNTPNWIMNGPAKALTLLGDLSIDNQVSFTNGNIVSNANTLIFGNAAINPSINPAANGEKTASRIIGKAQTSRNVGTGALTFLGANIPAGLDLGNVILLRTTEAAGIVNVAGNTSIACNWDIRPQFNVGRDNVSFNWLPILNNGKNTSNLSVWSLDPILGPNYVKQTADFIAPTTSPLVSTITLNAPQFSIWTVSDEVNPLPLLWLYVRARLKTNASTNIVVVSWATVSEKNTDYFDVERSTDGQNFEKIGVVTAKGNSNFNTQNEYSFDDLTADKLAQNLVYYRLRQVDKNNIFEYSKTLTVEMNNKNGHLFVDNVYPNPTNGIFNVILNLKNTPTQSAYMKIFDATGKILKTYNIRQDISQFDLSDLKSGMYYFVLSDEKQIKSYKIVKN